MKHESYLRYSGLYFERSTPIRLSGMKEGNGEKYHYTGLQIVSSRILLRIPENRPSEIFRDIYPDLIAAGTIHGYIYEGLWMEIGTLKEYLQTNLSLLKEPLPDALRPPGVQPELVSAAAKIENGAQVTDSIVMDGATIKGGSDVKNCIIGNDVTVDRNWEGVALARGFLPWYILNETKDRTDSPRRTRSTWRRA